VQKRCGSWACTRSAMPTGVPTRDRAGLGSPFGRHRAGVSARLFVMCRQGIAKPSLREQAQNFRNCHKEHLREGPGFRSRKSIACVRALLRHCTWPRADLHQKIFSQLRRELKSIPQMCLPATLPNTPVQQSDSKRRITGKSLCIVIMKNDVSNLVGNDITRVFASGLRICPDHLIDVQSDARPKCNICRLVVFVDTIEWNYS
jgi:hypothetical protein